MYNLSEWQLLFLQPEKHKWNEANKKQKEWKKDTRKNTVLLIMSNI